VGGDLVTMFLCGDVMTGRGVDQILPHPGDPPFGAAVELAPDGLLVLHPPAGRR